MPEPDFSGFIQTDIVNSHIHFKNLSLLHETKRFLGTLGMHRLGVACLAFPDLTNGNPSGLCFKACYPEETYIWAHLDYSELPAGEQEVNAHLKEQAERLVDMGFDGFKILETKPTVLKKLPYTIDHPVYDGFFHLVQEKQLPVIWHAADPDQNWEVEEGNQEAKDRGWDYTDGSFATKEGIYGQVEAVLEKFPLLKVVFAHFYFMSHDLPRAGRLLDRYPQVNLDITPGSEMFVGFTQDPAATRDFFIRYQDRIVYGDDTSVWEQGLDPTGIAEKVWFIRRFLETDEEFPMPLGDMNFLHRAGVFKGLGLPDRVLKKIYGHNLIRLTGGAPRVLHRELALAECRRLDNRQAVEILETR